MAFHEELIQSLRELPEANLKILDLVWKLLDAWGNLDDKKIAMYYEEVEGAVKEAEEYAKESKEMGECILKLRLP